MTQHAVLLYVQLCFGGGVAVCSGSQNDMRSSSSFVAVAIAVLDRAGERLLGALNAPLETLSVDDSGSAAALSQRR